MLNHCVNSKYFANGFTLDITSRRLHIDITFFRECRLWWWCICCICMNTASEGERILGFNEQDRVEMPSCWTWHYLSLLSSCSYTLYSIKRSGNSFLFKSNVQMLHLNQWIYDTAAIFIRLRFHIQSTGPLDGLLRRHPSQKSSILQFHYRYIFC